MRQTGRLPRKSLAGFIMRNLWSKYIFNFNKEIEYAIMLKDE
ncbi:MAG TPA: hypothetical protein DHV15_00765 [Treponema sp.]|uniref:Uncharacterized protein n=1 Tax=Treponema denticola (strain ATCC 35405 / DSM 14222 / CIP 103919 / JCM 8153 / KCTC 15104) TaxID=243275 RepID=Q73P85_TREDE|nr:hypothetical protein TDE_0914 [Treponema denticola ATCC 35405]HCY94033.1 hypothetical protein [Treponema sp.]